MKYTQQVSKEHYQSEVYDDVFRFISYHNQKQTILDVCKGLKNPTVLEIGIGNGFVASYLRKLGVNLTTFDFSEDLNPDIVGDVTQIKSIIKTKYSIISAFEIFEHVRYKDQESILSQLADLTTDYVLISLPQAQLHVSFWLKVNILKPLSFYFGIPFPVKHSFDGEHYWELGKLGYPIAKYRKLLKKYFILENEFTHPLDTYHRFFVLRKKI